MKTIYQRAKINGCQFVSTCVGITQYEWDKMMKGTRDANQKNVVNAALLAGVIDEWTAKKEIKCRWFNPYSHKVSRDYIVYVNSGIEHFIKVF